MDDGDVSEYLRMVRETPRPSEKQIVAFADFVSRAHSWYKHLPQEGRGSPFFIYLRPHSHEVWVDVGDGESGWRPIVHDGRDDSPVPHYAVGYRSGDNPPRRNRVPAYSVANMTSAESLERYGLLRYWEHGAPGQSRGSALYQARQDLRFQDDEGRHQPIPTAALERGLVYLRASVHPRRSPRNDPTVNSSPAAQDRATQMQEMVNAARDVVGWVYQA